MENKSNSGKGIGFTGLLQLLFITLKLVGVINWSWLWVLSPIWISLILTHKVVILYKKSGKHVLQSYDPNLFDEKMNGNTCVGLTWYELKLFTKKMKQIC